MATSGTRIPDELELETPLWRFALTVWRLPDVEQACLALQAKGWSITRVLCACWLAVEGRVFSGDEDEAVTGWRKDVTAVLRAVRKQLPKECVGVTTLRTTLASAELDAERIELALAFRALNNTTQHTELSDPGPTKPKLLARRNLEVAAPEDNMDMETSGLLDSLIDRLPLASTTGA